MNSPALNEDLDSYVVREVVKAICAESDRQGINFVDPGLVVLLRGLGSRRDQSERGSRLSSYVAAHDAAVATVRRYVDEPDVVQFAVAHRVVEAVLGLLADELAPRSAVVRPTRDSLAGFLADRRIDDLPYPFRTGVEPRDLDLADALLAEFWPVAVSDSQETP